MLYEHDSPHQSNSSIHRAGGKQADSLIARRARRLAQFAPIFRDRIAALTCCAPQAEDVADSFPGLLVALISDHATPAARRDAFHAVLDGRPLSEAAAILALPSWLRKIPAEAFREPIGRLPSEAQFTARISNFIPKRPAVVPDWLEQVKFADAACDSKFALWVAKHCGSVTPGRRTFFFLLLASWAWHAGRPETVGHRLIERPWSPQMGLRRATEELGQWRRRVELACLIGDGIETPWLQPASVRGYEFVPLVTLEDFLCESQAMNNCLDQYADRLSSGLVRIFSVRHRNKRVADVEIGPIVTPQGLPSIVQIKGPQNRRASQAVWQVTQEWIAQQPVAKLPGQPGPVRCDEAEGTAAFWRPYLAWLSADLRMEFDRTVLSGSRRNQRRHAPHPIISSTL